MSGHSFAVAAVSVNFSCFPRLTFSSQSCAIASRLKEVVLEADIGFSPAPTKAMFFPTWRRALAVAHPTADGDKHLSKDTVDLMQINAY